ADAQRGHLLRECERDQRGGRLRCAELREVLRIAEEGHLARQRLGERGGSGNFRRAIGPGSKLAANEGGQLRNGDFHGVDYFLPFESVGFSAGASGAVLFGRLELSFSM